MSNHEEIKPDVERDLKWRELAIRIEHYKYYLITALQAAAFFYAITGGVLGFYLGNKEAKDYHLEYFLLLPIIIGSVLWGIFIYGARLQEEAIDSMELIREELRERLELSIKQLYDAHLLSILLRIFGWIFLVVILLLTALPLLMETPWSVYLRLFLFLALGIIGAGACLPRVAILMDADLKMKRIERWIDTTDSWTDKINNEEIEVSRFKESDFYYQLRAALSRKTIEAIEAMATEKDKEIVKELIESDLGNFKQKWEERKTRADKERPLGLIDTAREVVHKIKGLPGKMLRRRTPE